MREQARETERIDIEKLREKKIERKRKGYSRWYSIFFTNINKLYIFF